MKPRKYDIMGEVLRRQKQYYSKKRCQICSLQDQESQLMLCDGCDDAYHTSCVGLPTVPDDDWICKECKNDLKEIKIQKAKTQNRPPIFCFKCHQSLKQNRFEVISLNQDNKTMIQQMTDLALVTCLYCHNAFHSRCFSDRKNSLNCNSCQKNIRINGPKGHEQFLQLIKKQQLKIKQDGFKILDKGVQPEQSRRTVQLMSLKLPSPLMNWQQVVQYQASLYYALKTQGITYCDDQIYIQGKTTFKAYNQKGKIQSGISRLHPKDQQTYITFRANTKAGKTVSIEIKEDRIKGFYIVSTDSIPAKTILSQYAGQIVNSRQASRQINDSTIMGLLNANSSAISLDIRAGRQGNMAKYFSGVNNADPKRARALQNVLTIRFLYLSRIRLIFYTKRDIQPGETMYCDYNGGKMFHQYPTETFIQ